MFREDVADLCGFTYAKMWLMYDEVHLSAAPGLIFSGLAVQLFCTPRQGAKPTYFQLFQITFLGASQLQFQAGQSDFQE